MSNQSLNRFEKLAQRLVEGSLGRLLGGRLELVDVANHLAAALEDGQREGQAPDLYYLHLHPDDYAAVWEAHSDLVEKLTSFLVEMAAQSGLSMSAHPLVDISEDDTLPPQKVVVKALHSEPPGRQGQTQILPPPADDNSVLALQTVDAFLIVQGRRHAPLDRPVITLGRRADNDIVIDSPAVSRQHAQLRWRYGRFILHDLGSRAGTLVNGSPITEAVLQPGDLISLSDVTLIYGEGLADEGGRRPRTSQADQETTPMDRTMLQEQAACQRPQESPER